MTTWQTAPLTLPAFLDAVHERQLDGFDPSALVLRVEPSAWMDLLEAVRRGCREMPFGSWTRVRGSRSILGVTIDVRDSPARGGLWALEVTP